jgi:hypothetical protein
MEKDSMSRESVMRADAARLDHAADHYVWCVCQQEGIDQAREVLLSLARVAFMTVSHFNGRDSAVPRQPFAVMTARRLIIVTSGEDAAPPLTIVDRKGGFVDLQA